MTPAHSTAGDLTQCRHMFAAALKDVFSGDVTSLASLLDQHPELVRQKYDGDSPPYDGLLHGATLLHHIAGNPFLEHLPENIVDVARTLLEAGADVNATCGGGPASPTSAGVTTAGLVATSVHAAKFGFASPLLDLLIEFGADLDADSSGGLMFLALHHAMVHTNQRDTAASLLRNGHPIDFCFAAGLGLLDYVIEEVEHHGVKPGYSDQLYRNHRPKSGIVTAQMVLQDAFLFAAMNGRIEVVDYLRTVGIDLNAFRPWGQEMITPMQGAAWAGWAGVVKLLLLAGAESSIVDPQHQRTALGWAIFANKADVVELMQMDAANIDLVDALELDNADRFVELLGSRHVDDPFGGSKPGVLLRTAVSARSKNIVKKLVDLGANAELPNENGITALDWAREKQDSSLVDLLTRRSNTITDVA